MASGWNLWVWLQCIGVVSGCCCKEVYRYPHNIINFPYSRPLVQWNPSIVVTIRDQPFGLYRGVATSQGLFYIIDKTCTCMV